MKIQISQMFDIVSELSLTLNNENKFYAVIFVKFQNKTESQRKES